MKFKNAIVILFLFLLTIVIGYFIITELKIEKKRIDLLELNQLDLSTKNKKKKFVDKAIKAGASNLQAKTLSILIEDGSLSIGDVAKIQSLK